MSVQRCQQETTSTEFVKWQWFLTTDMNLRTKQDYYLAQIAAEVRKTVVKKPQDVSIDDFLLEFREKEQEDKPPTEEELQERIQKSKAAWLGISGLAALKRKQDGKGKQ